MKNRPTGCLGYGTRYGQNKLKVAVKPLQPQSSLLMLYVVSRRQAVLDAIKGALKDRIISHAQDSSTYINTVLVGRHDKYACVIIDLATVPDAERLIGFTRGSSAINKLPIVVIGSEEQIEALSDDLQFSINGFVVVPFEPTEMAAVVASVCRAPLASNQ